MSGGLSGVSSGGGKKDDGTHTQPGGRINPGTGKLTPLLPTYPTTLDHLNAAEQKAVQVALLSYSQDVCARAALAYQQILAIVEAS